MKKFLLTLGALLCVSTVFSSQLIVEPHHVTGTYTTHPTDKQVTIYFNSSFVGTVNGVTFTYAAGGSYTWAAHQAGDTVGAITIVASAGAAEVTEM